MTDTSNKKAIVITAVIVAVIVVIALIITGKQRVKPLEEPEKIVTREQVPKDIKVPELDQAVVDKTIAVPEISIEAAEGLTDKKLRRFSITAENDIYTPSEVIANSDDTIHINFTAVGKIYDITIPDYGLKQTAQAGETKFLGFQAVKSGKFLFYCELCGGIDSNVTGHIIIVPKE